MWNGVSRVNNLRNNKNSKHIFVMNAYLLNSGMPP